MPSVDKVISELETVKMEIKINFHSYRRAKQRNIDMSLVKRKIRNLNLERVKENNQDDPRYSKTYKVTIKGSGTDIYEIPIYFNMGGNEVYVKSVWNK